MKNNFWEFGLTLDFEKTRLFFVLTSTEVYHYISAEMELLQGQEGNTLTVFTFCCLFTFFNIWSCATVNFDFSALLVSRYSVENSRRWIN